jgi:hypothetical protein
VSQSAVTRAQRGRRVAVRTEARRADGRAPVAVRAGRERRDARGLAREENGVAEPIWTVWF